jgi:hypothetical protein
MCTKISSENFKVKHNLVNTGLDRMTTLTQSLASVILQLLRVSPKLGFCVPSIFTSVVQRFSEKLGATSKFLVPPEW